MKIKTIVSLTAGLFMAANMALADEPAPEPSVHVWQDPSQWWDSHFTKDQDAPLFGANELSLDLFGSYLNPETKFSHLFQSNIRRGVWGGGAGLNYFIIKYVGLGADFNISDKPTGRLVDYVMGNAYLRLPIEMAHLAPYVYGGGGRGISPIYQWLYDGGVGLEFRLNPHTGIFGDARYIWAQKTSDAVLIRAGVRLTL